MKKIKFIVTAVIAAVICFQSTVFADSGGDSNIDNGGGNLLDGSAGNFWNPGNDGVRITVVDSESGAIKSASVDYSNANVGDIAFHFGKKCKSEYVSGGQAPPNMYIKHLHSRFPRLFPTENRCLRISNKSAAILQTNRLFVRFPRMSELFTTN